MTYNSIQTISQIMARFENEVKGNPARFRNDPFYIDFLIDSVLEHPDWIPSDYVRFHEEKKGEPIRLNVRDFLVRYSITKRDGKQEIIQLTSKASLLLDNILFEDDATANQSFADLIHMQGYYRRRWPLVARALMTHLTNKLSEYKDAQSNELAKRLQSLQSQMLVPMSKRFINNPVSSSTGAFSSLSASPRLACPLMPSWNAMDFAVESPSPVIIITRSPNSFSFWIRLAESARGGS